MPIAGLTDRGLSFPQIGVIRKGAPKSQKNAPGRDLTYFRVEFDTARPDLVEKFQAAYPDPEPRRLNVVFPFNDFDRQVQIFYEAYNKGRMVARAGTVQGLDPNQNYYLIKLNSKTGEVLAKAGYWVTGEKKGQPAVYDKSQPEYSMTYRDKNGHNKKLDIFCKPITRIKIVIPELGELAYVLLKSSSIYDAMNLSEQLIALWEITRGNWAGVPLVLERKPTQVLCPDENGNKTYREKWLLSIQALPAWSEAKLLAMRKASMLLAAGNPLQVSLPAGESVHEEDDEDEDRIPDEPEAWINDESYPPAGEVAEIDDEILDGEFDENAPETQPETGNEPDTQPETNGNITDDHRAPQRLKTDLHAAALKGGRLDPQEINKTAACLDYLLQGSARRMEFLSWLAGKSLKSSKDMDPALLKALHDYLKPVYDPNNGVFYPANQAASIEVTHAHAEGLKANGQKELFS
ncbi:MAG: hypothetical protein QMD04_10690 [Anaerolineales bacterium]|nr:hypothetical protein [Anaerolineales bacterium]